jgi:hypothetical protein
MSKGVRFFTLQDYGEFGWVSGLLESRDNRGQPIAAKIVLIPAEQHVKGSKLNFDPTDEKFSDYISEPVNPAELKEELRIDAGDRHLLRGLSAEELVQALIWNGSLRTLHGEPQPIPDQKYHLGLRRMIAIQNRLRSLKPQPPNDLYFFMRLLSDERVYDAINEFLVAWERPPKPGPL